MNKMEMNYQTLILILSVMLLFSKESECRPYQPHQRSKRQSLVTDLNQNHRNIVQSVLLQQDLSETRLRRSTSRRISPKKQWQWASMLPSSVVKPRMDVAPES